MKCIHGVPFTNVTIEPGSFWGKRIETNRTATLQACLRKCEETGRFDNFAVAGGLKKGTFKGIYFNDSDVFKIIEGASYVLKVNYDAELDAYLDQLISWIAAAQEPDGYLYTARTINDPDYDYPGKEGRWTHLQHGHELYNVGHLYEAATAHYQATGKRTLLDVAIKSADLVCKTFGTDEGQINGVPGHEEIEIGLVKLSDVTSNEAYVAQAKTFLDMRGNPHRKQQGNREVDALYYIQDHKPVIEQDEAVGHAVRGGYLYTAMADVARQTKDDAYHHAVNRLWENITFKKLAVTGGIGARHKGETFGDNYELPNSEAYNETCAAISNIFFNYRMFLIDGDGKYMDVLERILYNGFLSGVSLSGTEFFYVNSLEWNKNDKESKAPGHRQPWFGCACCPSNVVRLMPSLPGYLYSQDENGISVNLFAASQATIERDGAAIGIKQKTGYPFEGQVKLEISLEDSASFNLRIRIPGWARNQPVPGDLYRYVSEDVEPFVLTVNRAPVETSIERGYVTLSRVWKTGDEIELMLPMNVHRVRCHENVSINRAKLALERGPLVYCMESLDSDGPLEDITLCGKELTAEWKPDLLGGVTVIQGDGFFAIPYYARSHRAHDAMKVWLNE